MGTPNKNSCKTAAVMNLIGKGPAPEKDIRILPDKPRDIETITGEILEAKQRAGEAILTIGHGLIEAKALLSHGEWLLWLAERVEFSEDTAENYMKLARKYSNSETLRNLGYSKALALLALPDKTRDEFIEATHVVDGEEKTVGDMSVRELKAVLLKERDEARLAAAQAQADFQAADAAREKLSQDMALANKRIEGLNAEVAEKSAKIEEAQDAVTQLERELEEFRSRPVDVAVQTDEAAVEAARKEAAERTRAQVEKEFKTARAAAQEQVTAANEAAAQVRGELAQAKRELDDLRFEAARLERKAALTSDPDMALCNELFDQSQVLFNMMYGVLMKKRNKEPEKAEKLQNAMLTLLDKERKMVLG